MQPASFAAPRARSHYRHELRTLTYVTLYQANSDSTSGEEANVGVIRNLNHRGAAVQLVSPVRPQQRLRLRFELKHPRVRVETHVEVTWVGSSGQCGVCFVDLPARAGDQINEWIFSNLLESAGREADQSNGLMLSPSPRPAIVLDAGVVAIEHRRGRRRVEEEQAHEDRKPVHSEALRTPVAEARSQLSPLSQPHSGRTLAWLVDSLVMIAGLLFFALIFLAIAHELPPWPLTLAAVAGAAVFVGVAYWVVFELFGRASLGVRLADAAGEKEKGEELSRFR